MISQSNPVNLCESAQATLDASGAATVSIGPGNGSPVHWAVSGVILVSSRPGAAPIPRAQVSLDTSGLQGISYDGSFTQGAVNPPLTLTMGQHLVCAWTGGKEGDTVTLTVTGTAW